MQSEALFSANLARKDFVFTRAVLSGREVSNFIVLLSPHSIARQLLREIYITANRFVREDDFFF